MLVERVSGKHANGKRSSGTYFLSHSADKCGSMKTRGENKWSLSSNSQCEISEG